MSASVGLGYLGVDAASTDVERVVAEHVNPLIERITGAEAFMLARAVTEAVIGRFIGLTQLLPSEGGKVAVDLLSLSETVLASLCSSWFGLPGTPPVGTPPLMVTGGRASDDAPIPARCPGHLLTTSRYVFAPRPNPVVKRQGPEQGQAVLQAFKDLLARPAPALGGLGTLIRDTLAGELPNAPPDLLARTLAGVMLGFPPTVHGNFVRVVGSWIDDRTLWSLQQRLRDAKAAQPVPADAAAAALAAWERAKGELEDALMSTMCRRPVPEMIWRTAAPGITVDGQAPIDADRCVVLGLASAVAGPNPDRMLMFGGRRGAAGAPPHACPGYGMAIGVLLGLLSGLLEAGTLRPTGSSIQLTLIPLGN